MLITVLNHSGFEQCKIYIYLSENWLGSQILGLTKYIGRTVTGKWPGGNWSLRNKSGISIWEIENL